MKKKSLFCLLTAVLFTAIPSVAQTTDNGTASQLKRLLQFKGYWETRAAILQMDGKESKFAYYADFKSTADNNGFVMNEWAAIPGMGNLKGANLAGVSPYDGKIHWFSVDNMGTAHEHIGEFTDDKHFSMVYKGSQDGKEYIETISVEFTGPGVMNLMETAMIDGKEALKITGTFHRKKAN